LLVIQGCGEEDDPRRALHVGQFPQHLQTILARHADIENHHIRLMLAHGAQGLVTIAAAGDHLTVGFQPKEVLQGVENQGMIIG
jgi:hypothetical protein